MPGRTVTAAIVVLWLGTSAWLFQREVLPRWLPAPPPDFSAVMTGPAHSTSRWDIRLNTNRIGHSVVVTESHPDGSGRVQNTIRLNQLSFLPGLDTGDTRCVVTTEFRLSAGSVLEEFATELRLLPDQFVVTLTGQRRGPQFDIRMRAGDFEQHFQMPLETKGLVSQSLNPFLRLPTLRVGQRWSFRMLDPLATLMGQSSVVEATAEVVAERQETWQDEPVRVFIVQYRHGNWTAEAWVDRHGEVLRQEVPVFVGKFVLERVHYHR